MDLVRKFSKALLVLGVVFAMVYMLNSLVSGYWLRVLNLMMIYIILTVSLNLTNGFTGISNLGQIGFMAIGAYTSAILTLSPHLKQIWLTGLPHGLSSLQLHLLPAMLIGGILAAIVAFITGPVFLRLRGIFISVATLGFLIVVKVIAENWMGITRGGRGIPAIPLYTNLWWTSGVALVTIYTVWRIVRSPYGRGMMAIREDDLAAQSIGINITKVKLLAFVITAFFSGIAGALWANLIGAISPESFYMWLTFFIIIILIVGGMGSITGSVVSAIVFAVFIEGLRSFENSVGVYGISYIILALAFIIIIILRPAGVFGDREVNWRWLLNFFLPARKRLANKRGGDNM